MKLDDDKPTRAVLTTIELLDPYAVAIRREYAAIVDPSPTPCCGWLAMWCELVRIAERTGDPRHAAAKAAVYPILISIASARQRRGLAVSELLHTRGLPT